MFSPIIPSLQPSVFLINEAIGSVCKAKDFKRAVKAKEGVEGASVEVLGGLHPSISKESKNAVFWAYMEIEYIGG